MLPATTIFAAPPGPWARISDPAVAYDPLHDVWMISTLAIDASVSAAVLTSRSTDGGLTWQNPVTTSLSSGAFYDKNWITCDTWPQSPHYGNCYQEWDDSTLYMSTSTDGGLTWGPKKTPARAVSAGSRSSSPAAM
ncbi:MAG TPA: sialidase family protein [Gaiellaceae bacterium]|nr:sialidase family protein [Gaiellaceae bacterium]